MAPERLSQLQRRILAWLLAEDQRTRGTMSARHPALVRALAHHKGNLSTSLKSLEAKGLVRITRTPGEAEQEFIALWQAGWETAAIAAHLGIKPTTAQSRARRLQQKGLIQPRPRGGAYPSQQALARQGGEGAPSTTSRPVQRPVQRSDTGAVSSVDTGAVQPIDTGPVQKLDRLEDEVQGLRRLVQSLVDRLDHPPVQTPVQITTLSPYPKGKAVRWNLWILDAIRDELAALATERGISPSQLVQELLWKELRRE